MPDDAAWQELLVDAERGDRAARDRLFVSLYDELRRVARRELHRGAGGLVTMSATALVHEAYEALAHRTGLAFPDRARFLAYMARAMRGLIIDSARERQAQKRGGEFHITRLDTALEQHLPEVGPLDRLSAALDALAVSEPRLAEIVDLKYFCGFTFVDIAAMSGVSERTVQRQWEKARLLLFVELDGEAPAD
jgi:RNA polymerase sigma factor (TIGR02999 family)